MNVEDLLQKIGKVCAERNRRYKEADERGEHFNLFSILGVERNELKHSAFLAELLNPKGCHGMGGTFLQEFITRFHIGKAFQDINRVRVFVEYSIGSKNEKEDEGGRLDILLKYDRHAVIIENKINAVDQPNQLLRYKNYASHEFKSYDLIYLTLSGGSASDDSVGHNQNLEYKRLSYKDDILAWLEWCLSKVAGKTLIESNLKQYIEIIKEITEQNMGNKDIDKLVELACENLETTAALYDSSVQEAIFEKLMDVHIFQPLKKWAKENGYGEIEYDKNKREWMGFRPQGWEHSIAVAQDPGKNTPWSDLYFGISFPDGDGPLQEKGLVSLGSKTNIDNVYWPYGDLFLPSEMRNWHSFDIYTSDTADEIVKWIKEHVEQVKKEVQEKGIKI